MASKKYKLLFGVLTLLTSGAFAQEASYVYDSSVVPAKRVPQQTEFLNNSYSYPAKPRNMWEIGASVGMPTVSGDVSAQIPTVGFGVHVRKALGYVMSLRLQYINGTAKGLNWQAASNFGKNIAWQDYTPQADQVYYNYKAKIQDLSLQSLFSLHNIRFHKKQTGITLYGGAGIGATLYQTKVNALDANGNPYTNLFNGITSGTYKNRKDVIKALKDGMDDSYETNAENEGDRRPKLGDNTLKPSGTILGGIAFRLSKRINLALEDRFTLVKTDLLDGQRWQEHAFNDAVLTSDFDSYNFVSLGLNFNIGAKAVEPLWWINPLDYAYDELRKQRIINEKAKECPDADGDGILDCVDREPNTPANAPVDSHGVARDTDGDGVPDYMDKQLITPTDCQPVDADGVGKCPDPECCKNKVQAHECPCDYPSLSFLNNSIVLSADAKSMLATVASKLKAGGPECTISITGYPAANKSSQAVCQKRLKAVSDYLVENEGISADRISIDCQVDGGDKNTVDIKCNQ